MDDILDPSQAARIADRIGGLSFDERARLIQLDRKPARDQHVVWATCHLSRLIQYLGAKYQKDEGNLILNHGQWDSIYVQCRAAILEHLGEADMHDEYEIVAVALPNDLLSAANRSDLDIDTLTAAHVTLINRCRARGLSALVASAGRLFSHMDSDIEKLGLRTREANIIERVASRYSDRFNYSPPPEPALVTVAPQDAPVIQGSPVQGSNETLDSKPSRKKVGRPEAPVDCDLYVRIHKRMHRDYGTSATGKAERPPTLSEVVQQYHLEANSTATKETIRKRFRYEDSLNVPERKWKNRYGPVVDLLDDDEDNDEAFAFTDERE